MKRKTGNNNGFTLIEVIISLVILAILILPMLSIYSVVAKVNTQSQAQQEAVVLGQNLMESIKAEDMEDIRLMFNGIRDFQILNSNLNGAVNSYRMKAYSEGGYGEYTMDSGHMLRCSPDDISKKSYLFGIEGILDGGTAYDAVITMDALPYCDTVRYPDNMNNYRMPDLCGLNQNKVTLIDLEGMTTAWSDDSVSAVADDSKSTDNQAVSDLYNIWLSYLGYLNEKGLEPPAVLYTTADIEQGLQKDIQINLKKSASEKTIQVECKVSYSCDLDLNGDGVKENVEYQQYAQVDRISKSSNTDREIYLFYTPSGFMKQDMISIHNDGARVKLYIVKQDGTTAKDVVINRSELNLADTAIDTNLTDEELDEVSIPLIERHTLVSYEEAKDRIYCIKVEIYQGGSIASKAFTDPYTVLTSTWEDES